MDKEEEGADEKKRRWCSSRYQVHWSETEKSLLILFIICL